METRVSLRYFVSYCGPEKPGPRKTWTLKTWTLKYMNPEKHGINMGLRNMSDLRVIFYKGHAQCDLYQQIRVLTDI